ncbi:hypothetical protein E2C06_03180 [Dankookia rubra]|uniref:Uncharacterized protein n=1 Tax=Dankookia rubra TaxID=1442381 RepID=A0A4R5QLU9_9PROT|nr:hypothetical protein [Dankookia rubra]TDH63858.1 hypothetical protein E2C06_03180 [Dankookia rubra]
MRLVLGVHLALLRLGAAQTRAAEPPVTLPADILDQILAAGQFTDPAVAPQPPGRLPAAPVARSVAESRAVDPTRRAADPLTLPAAEYQAVARLGLLPLLLSTAMWGIGPAAWLPEDPAACPAGHDLRSCGWAGPAKGRGKHLRSLPDGGIGIPPLDAAGLARVIDCPLGTDHGLAPAEAAVLRRLAGGLTQRNGLTWASIRQGPDWPAFAGAMRQALARPEAQRFITECWLRSGWLGTCRKVVRAGGTGADALTLARVTKSWPVLAFGCVLPQALPLGDPAARADAMLKAYVTRAPGPKSSQNPCAHGRPSYLEGGRCRPNVILRPGAVLAAAPQAGDTALAAGSAGLEALAGRWRERCRLAAGQGGGSREGGRQAEAQRATPGRVPSAVCEAAADGHRGLGGPPLPTSAGMAGAGRAGRQKRLANQYRVAPGGMSSTRPVSVKPCLR